MTDEIRELLLSVTVSANDMAVTITCPDGEVRDRIFDFLMSAGDAGFGGQEKVAQ